jgi:hypothetical protein
MFLFNHRIVKFLKEIVTLKGRFGNCLDPIGIARGRISNRLQRLFSVVPHRVNPPVPLSWNLRFVNYLRVTNIPKVKRLVSSILRGQNATMIRLFYTGSTT